MCTEVRASGYFEESFFIHLTPNFFLLSPLVLTVCEIIKITV